MEVNVYRADRVMQSLDPILCRTQSLLSDYKAYLKDKSGGHYKGKVKDWAMEDEKRLTQKCLTAVNKWIDFICINCPRE